MEQSGTESNKSLCEKLYGFPAKVQSLDPSRPVEHVAFDNMHYPVTPILEDKTSLSIFIDELVETRADSKVRKKQLSELAWLGWVIDDYAHQLRCEHPDNAAEIERRLAMWMTEINERHKSTPKHQDPAIHILVNNALSR